MLNSWLKTQPFNLVVLATSLSCGSSNSYSTLLALPASDFSNITGVASVLQKPNFTLVMLALSTKIYKMDSDLSKTISKMKVFWSLKVKKDSLLFYFTGSLCKLQFWFECHINFDNRSLFYFDISLPNGTHLLSLIAGNSNLKQACLSTTVLTAD